MRLKNPKDKGGRNERRMRDWLQDRGYSVTKAGGSLGCWDLIGHRRHQDEYVDWSVMGAAIVMVQVKSTRPPGPKERKAMEAYIHAHIAEPVSYWIASWKARARRPMLKVWRQGAWEKVQ